jgi:hypothetical protein
MFVKGEGSGIVSESDIKQTAAVITSNSLTLGTELHNKFTKDNNNGAERCQKLLSENVRNADCRNFEEITKSLTKERESFDILKDVSETGLERGHTYEKSNVFMIEDQVSEDLSNALIIEAQNKDDVICVLKKWKVENHKPHWSEVSPMSSEIKYFWNRLDSLQIKDGILYRCWESDDGSDQLLHIVLPRILVHKVLYELHNTPVGGHLGIKKTLFKVRKRFMWYSMRKDVTDWCNKCIECAARKGPLKRAKAKFKQYNVGEPLERIGIDVMGPMTRSTKGHKYILTIVDYFSKWIVAVPMRNQEAKTVAHKLVENFITIFGVPKQIHSDQGTNFESLVFKEMCQILGSHKTRTTAFRPQSDGLAERANRTIKSMISKFVSDNQKDWDEYLSVLTLAYNASVQESTGFSPSAIMFGRELTLPIDLVLGNPEPLYQTHSDFARQLEKKIKIVHNSVRKNIKFASETQKRKYDHRAVENSYSEGDLVWLYCPQVKPGVCSKFARHWNGPYKVLSKINDVLYRVQMSQRSKPKVVHHDRLKKYLSE